MRLLFLLWLAAVPLLIAAENLESLPHLPPTPPEKAAATFKTLHGFHLDLLAAEPLVASPVAMAYDEDGAAYVCEMVDYPYTDKAHHKAGQENPTDQPIGRIRRLTSSTGDGRFDHSTIFAEGLSWPTGVCCWKGGVFVAATPDLWYFKDTKGTGVADVRQKIFTGFRKLNVQAVMNNLIWGPDNLIYGAGGSNGGDIRPADQPDAKPIVLGRHDFRFDPANPVASFELISGGARFGNSFDDWGHRFLCNIRNPAEHVVLPTRALARNPYAVVPSVLSDVAEAGDHLPVYRVSPPEAWRELRARRWSGDRDTIQPHSELVGAGVVTSSSGVTVYRGAAYPPEFAGNIFTAEPAGNLLYRQVLVPNGVTFKSHRVDGEHEIAASTDQWCRPVNFVNAPDGTLHLCDMYREVIEHPWSIPEDIHAALDLLNGRDRGRIWRLAPPDFKPGPPPHLSTASTEELVHELGNPNSWWRETAQRLLVERGDAAAVPLLRQLLKDSKIPLARWQALGGLQGLHALTEEDFLLASHDERAEIRARAVEIDPARSGPRERIIELAEDPDARVRFEVALALGDIKSPVATNALARIIKRDAGDPWISAAILSSSAERSGELLAELSRPDGHLEAPAGGAAFLRQLAAIVGARNKAEEVASLTPLEGSFPDDALLGYGEGMKRAGRNLRQAASNKEFYAAWLDRSRREALDPKAEFPRRQNAMEFLAFDDFDHVHETLAKLLQPTQPQPLQAAAVQDLASFNRPEVAALLLERWPIFTAGTRTEAITALLSPKPRLLLLLDAIEAGRIPAHEVPFARRAALLRTTDPELKPRLEKLFGEAASNSRSSVIERYRPALALTGDPSRGEKIYQANCMICHRHGRQGNDIGPNLASIRQWSPEQVLVNVLDPNREVAPNFIQYSLETTNGNVALGLIGDESPASLTLKGADGISRTFLRSEIKTLTSLNISLMPEGLEANIPVPAMADLISFVLSDPK